MLIQACRWVTATVSSSLPGASFFAKLENPNSHILQKRKDNSTFNIMTVSKYVKYELR